MRNNVFFVENSNKYKKNIINFTGTVLYLREGLIFA